MNRLSYIVTVLAMLFLLGWLAVSILSLFVGELRTGNVALIPIEGTIVTQGSASLWGEGVASSTDIMGYIKEAEGNPNIKAILLEINSPGGSGVASEEIAQAVKRSNKTTVAYIREVGASGGYWVASAADRVYANRMSLTGSIGVIASYLEFSGLLTEYNVRYERLVAGSNKDMGSPLRRLTDEEREKLQTQLDLVHEFFINEVAANRGLTPEAVSAIATGEPMLGQQALAYGLIDEIGGKEQAVRYIEQRFNITAGISEYRERRTILDMLSGVLSHSFYSMGQGIGHSLLRQQLTVQT